MATSQSGGVTSLPYINTVTPVSTDGVPLYTTTEPVSLPGTGGSVSEVRGPSDPKVSKFSECQCAMKVMSENLGLVNSVLNLPDRQVKIFVEIEIKRC